MEYSKNFNFALPSRDNDVDLADINELSNNFRKVDENATKKQDFENLKNEVEDARVGYDGAVYGSLGSAIREQTQNVKSDIDEVKRVETANGVEKIIRFKEQDNNLIAITSKEKETLDTIAYDDKTYRDIFITNNLADIASCENGFGTGEIFRGSPEITTDTSQSGSHSLKCFSTDGTPQAVQYFFKGGTFSQPTTLYASCSAKIINYTTGLLGVQLVLASPINGGLSNVNNEFTRVSAEIDVTNTNYNYALNVGSLSSPILEGYIDDIVLIDKSIFSNMPDKATMDILYDNYIKIITGQGLDTGTEYVIGQKAADVNEDYTDEQCVTAFMEKVNEKAQELGMTNSVFVTPSGAEKLSGITEITEENNRSTARDLVRLFVGATAYNELLKVWGKPSKTIYTKNENSVRHDFTSVMYADMNTDEGTNTSAKSPYYFMGGKTGTWVVSGYSTYNFGAICKVKDKLVVGVVMKASNNANRYKAINQLFDIAKQVIENPETDTSSLTISCSNGACCCILPEYNVNMYENYPFDFLFEQNANTQILPASVTKVVTSMVMLDYIKDLDETITFKSTDIDAGGSGNVFSAGDIITYRDSLYALMLASSNMTAQCVARNVGKKILELG